MYNAYAISMSSLKHPHYIIVILRFQVEIIRLYDFCANAQMGKGEIMLNLDKFDKLRKEKGISKSFICRKMGVSESYFNDLKLGKARVKQHYLEIIADVLGTSVAYLTDESEDSGTIFESDTDGILGELMTNPDYRILCKTSKNLNRMDLKRLTEFAKMLEATKGKSK